MAPIKPFFFQEAHLGSGQNGQQAIFYEITFNGMFLTEFAGQIRTTLKTNRVPHLVSHSFVPK